MGPPRRVPDRAEADDPGSPPARSPPRSRLPLASSAEPGEAAPARERADAARNRARILEATREILKGSGGVEFCMDAVAAAAGVGKGTLYRRFPDRASLCLAILDEETRHLQDAAIAGFGLPDGTPEVEHLIALGLHLFDFHVEHRALLEVAWERASPRGKLEHPAYAWQRTAAMAHLVRAVRRGELAEGLDPLLTAELFLAPMDPFRIGWLVDRRGRAAVRAGYETSWRRMLAAPPLTRVPGPPS